MYSFLSTFIPPVTSAALSGQAACGGRPACACCVHAPHAPRAPSHTPLRRHRSRRLIRGTRPLKEPDLRDPHALGGGGAAPGGDHDPLGDAGGVAGSVVLMDGSDGKRMYRHHSAAVAAIVIVAIRAS